MVFACLIIRRLQLIVELKSELDVSWRLCTGDLPQRWTQVPRIRRVGLHMVESIDEVRAELQSEPLRHLEVLMKAEVYVRVVCRPQVAELTWTVAEGSYTWC